MPTALRRPAESRQGPGGGGGPRWGWGSLPAAPPPSPARAEAPARGARPRGLEGSLGPRGPSSSRCQSQMNRVGPWGPSQNPRVCTGLSVTQGGPATCFLWRRPGRSHAAVARLISRRTPTVVFVFFLEGKGGAGGGVWTAPRRCAGRRALTTDGRPWTRTGARRPRVCGLLLRYEPSCVRRVTSDLRGHGPPRQLPRCPPPPSRLGRNPQPAGRRRGALGG